ncbi:Serine transporter [Entomobacter blattae]|uniref:Serine transporter n=2 Tax=Entomobacter blattae TaxID=2762277 RepID=A0A7H1NPI2_9PROT|nr:Serine transporter [Entomobacter blattae]
MLSLYGTAIGAGILFLPINAGMGGLIPLIFMICLAYPMTYYSHLGLNRFVLAGKGNSADITDVVKEFFGKKIGHLITFLYFFAIFPILLVYSVAITNTVQSFMLNQLGLVPPARPLLALSLVLFLACIAHMGTHIIVRAMSLLVFPFVITLLLFSLYLTPYWSIVALSAPVSTSQTLGSLWLLLPVMVFSFNFSPIISSFTVVKKQEYKDRAAQKCAQILRYATLMMVITVSFFVLSCVLSLSPADLAEAKQQNISILTYMANHFNAPLIAIIAPLVAIVAISKSFLGHFLGAREGINSLILTGLNAQKYPFIQQNVERISVVFIIITCWLVATLNPGILTIIETLGGPIIAILLFIMPAYALFTIPALKPYKSTGKVLFVLIFGVFSVSAMLYSLCA